MSTTPSAASEHSIAFAVLQRVAAMTLFEAQRGSFQLEPGRGLPCVPIVLLLPRNGMTFQNQTQARAKAAGAMVSILLHWPGWRRCRMYSKYIQVGESVY